MRFCAMELVATIPPANLGTEVFSQTNQVCELKTSIIFHIVAQHINKHIEGSGS